MTPSKASKAKVGEWWLTASTDPRSKFAKITRVESGKLSRGDLYENMPDSFPMTVNTNLTDSFLVQRISRDETPEYYL